MVKFVKRIARRTRGMEALQALLLLAAAFVIIEAVKQLGNETKSAAKTEMQSSLSGTGGGGGR